MIIFGGERKFDKHMKMRSCFNEFLKFDFEKKETTILRTFGEYVESRRNHTAFVIGKYMFLHGGINNHGKFLSDLSYLNFENSKM
jgi:hypothetical protein